MTVKKHSVSQAVIIATLIITLNLVGISYGLWQDNVTGEITAHTGYIELSFSEEPEIESDGFKSMSARRADGEGNKVIEIDGTIERDSEGIAKGKLILDYIVENSGSLPVGFHGIQIEDSGMGELIIEGPDGWDIGPGDSSAESITIQIDASVAEDTQGDDTEETSDTCEFEVVLNYKIGSWTDKLAINGSIKVSQSSGFSAMPSPALSMISPPAQEETDTGVLPDGAEPDTIPEGPSDEELYGTGETTEEPEEPEAGDEEED